MDELERLLMAVDIDPDMRYDAGTVYGRTGEGEIAIGRINGTFEILETQYAGILSMWTAQPYSNGRPQETDLPYNGC